MGKDSWHWYRAADGEPMYEIMGQNGKLRKPTMRDAKRGLKGKMAPHEIVPSVTSILSAIGKPPGLVLWLVRTALECAATNPARAGEDADDYCRRLSEDADRHRLEAAQLGTAIHKFIERYLTDGKWPAEAEPYGSLLEPVEAWLKANVKEVLVSEKSFATPIYGGKYDLVARMQDDTIALIDFKTQAVKREPRVYDEWGEQLVAYAKGCDYLIDSVANLIISTEEPLVYYHEWDDVSRLFSQWECKLRYFQLSRNWWPPEPGEAKSSESQ